MGSENEIPVRAIAMRSFSMFSRKIEKYGLEVDESFFKENKIAEEMLSFPVTYETITYLIEALIELCKLSKSQRIVLTGFGEYILSVFKLSNSTTTTNQIFSLLGQITNEKQEI